MRGELSPLQRHLFDRMGFGIVGTALNLGNAFVQSANRLYDRGGYYPGTEDTEGVDLANTVAGGAMAGSLAAPRPRGSLGSGGRVLAERPSVDGVMRVLDDLGLQAARVRENRGTFYIQVPDQATGRHVTIRVAPDGHVGIPKHEEVAGPHYFDTGTEPPANIGPIRHASVQDRINRATHNEGGGSYSDMGNLRDALAWRFSRDLVSPDSAPRTQRLPRERNAMADEMPADPNQMRLLASGIPIWHGVMDRAAMPQEQPAPGAGRFAAPWLVRAGDNAMVNDTRMLTAQLAAEREGLGLSFPQLNAMSAY